MVSKGRIEATGATPQGQRGCCAYEEQLTSRTSCSVTVRLAESAGSQLLLQRPCPTCATSRTSTTMSIPTLTAPVRAPRSLSDSVLAAAATVLRHFLVRHPILSTTTWRRAAPAAAPPVWNGELVHGIR
jgi:hypothetical protein